MITVEYVLIGIIQKTRLCCTKPEEINFLVYNCPVAPAAVWAHAAGGPSVLGTGLSGYPPGTESAPLECEEFQI